METKVKKSYDDYDFCAVVKEVEHFCNIDLSSFYFDVVKDTLYCDPANSIKRRRIQTAMYRVARILMQVMSPIMCFTMDEAWEHLPKLNKDQLSVHLENYKIPYLSNELDEEIIAKYNALRLVRRTVNIKLEEIRNNKEIGASYEADVIVIVPTDQWRLLTATEEAKRLFAVSKLIMTVGDVPQVKATHAFGPQCQRCWNFVDDVGKFDPDDVCERCATALKQVK
jgi:isoleucyl-tRNA synthetase